MEEDEVLAAEEKEVAKYFSFFAPAVENLSLERAYLGRGIKSSEKARHVKEKGILAELYPRLKKVGEFKKVACKVECRP